MTAPQEAPLPAPVAPEVYEGPHDTADTVALGGLRNRITMWRIDRAIRLSEDNDASRDVVSSMAGSIINGSDPLPKNPNHVKTDRERRAHNRNAARARKNGLAILRMEARVDVFGTTNDNGEMRDVLGPDGKPAPVMFNGSVTEQQRRANVSYVLRGGESDPGIDYGYATARTETEPSDLGTQAQRDRLENGRYSRSRVRSELKAARQQAADKAEAQGHQTQMRAAAEGTDLHGKKTSARAERHAKRAGRLNKKLEKREAKKAKK